MVMRCGGGVRAWCRPNTATRKWLRPWSCYVPGCTAQDAHMSTVEEAQEGHDARGAERDCPTLKLGALPPAHLTSSPSHMQRWVSPASAHRTRGSRHDDSSAAAVWPPACGGPAYRYTH